MLHAPHAKPGAPSDAPGALVPATSLPDDAGLLACLATRDDGAALGALYDRHSRQAFAVAYRIVQSPEVAEEVVQDAFLALWRRADRYAPGRGDVRGWLLAIVRNRAIDQLRAQQARPRRAVGDHDLAGLLADPGDTEKTALAAVEASAVRAAVARLSPVQRRAVELAYFAGLSYPEVAQTMGAPLGTVKSRMRLALTSLRAALTATPVVG